VVENAFSDLTKGWSVYTEWYIPSCSHPLPSAALGFSTSLNLNTISIKRVASYIPVTCLINLTGRMLSLGHYTCHLDQSKVLLASPIIKCTEDVLLLMTLQYSRTKVFDCTVMSATEQSCFQWRCQWATSRALQNHWHAWREAYCQWSHLFIQYASTRKGSQQTVRFAPLTPSAQRACSQGLVLLNLQDKTCLSGKRLIQT